MAENTIDVRAHTHADPKDGPPPRSWLDKGVARLVAFAIAAALALALFVGLGDEVMALVSDQPIVAEGEEAGLVDDPAVATCIEQRGGDVDRMLADGVITDAQHADFRNRAVALCRSGAQTAPRI